MEQDPLTIDEVIQDREQKTSVCVIQTRTGQEEAVIDFIDRMMSDGLVTDKFIPMRELARKENGRWIKKKEKLFPGYIFIETTDMKEFFMQLKKIPRLTKLLSYGKYNFYALNEKEIRYVNRISSTDNNHVFGMSRVMIDDANKDLKPGDRVVIVSGGLLDFKGDIIRFDLHHRKAYIKSELFGGSEVCVGIELVEKI